MEDYILKENVLSTDVLKVARKLYVFKGRYVAIIIEHTFATSWSDKESIRGFRSTKSLFKYLRKYYKERVEELEVLIGDRY